MFRMGAVVQWIKPLLGMPTFHTGVPIQTLDTPVGIQLPADACWKAVGAWVRVTHMGQPHWVLGCWFV